MSAVYGILSWCGEQKSKDAIVLLRQMIECGANPNARDSYGNSCLDRALIDTNQVLDNPSYSPDMDASLNEIFKIIIDAGADRSSSCETRESVQEFAKDFGLEKFLEH